MASKKTSKKLTPGSFKSGAGGRKASTRRTGRTTGISQSAFAGYAFQSSQPAVQPPSEPDADLTAKDEAADEVPTTATTEPDSTEPQDSKD